MNKNLSIDEKVRNFYETLKNKMNFFISYNLFFKLIRANYKFYFPSQKKILIFDYHGSNYIKKFLPTHDYDILSVRYESFNVPIILKCLLNFKLSFRNYMKEYIYSVNPKILITNIDTNVFFLSNKIKQWKEIFVSRWKKNSSSCRYFFY